MKKIFTIVISLTITFPLFSQEYDFRNVRWGFSREQVRASEIIELNIIGSGETSVAGLDCHLTYRYDDNKLISATYIFTNNKFAYNRNIEDYNKLKNLLINKYETPLIDTIAWKDELFKDMPKEWGTAIAMGQLEYFSYWETQRTGISLIMNCNDDNEIRIAVMYRSTAYFGSVNKPKEENDKKN